MAGDIPRHRWQNCLTEYRTFLIDFLQVTTSLLLDRCIEQRILNKQEMDAVKAEKTEGDQVRKLIDILLRKDKNYYLPFLRLVYKSQRDIAEDLAEYLGVKEYLTSPTPGEKKGNASALGVKEYWTSPTPREQKGDTPTLGSETSSSNEVSWFPAPSRQAGPYSKQSRYQSTLPEDCYTMKTVPRGFMLIINNVDFEDGQEKRNGSDADRDQLKKIFEDFGFNVEVINNCPKEKMLNRIKACAEDANEFKDVDSVVVAILSHGEDDKIFGTDGLAIIIDDLIRPFNGYNSPNLVGKPKLFILQMCRGRDYRMSLPKADGPSKDHVPSPTFMVKGGGVPTEPVLSNAETDEDEEKLRKRVAGLHISDQEKAEMFLHPDSDMVLAYSTLPGQISYRDDKKGTWYIQALCNVFVKYAREEHVMDMLIRANNEIIKFGLKSNVQCPEPRTRLTKKWYINPMY